MGYREPMFEIKENEPDNIFADVIAISNLINLNACNAKYKHIKPQQAKTEILKYTKEIEQKLEGIKG